MILKHNISALNTQRQVGLNTDNIAKISEKLSSGYQINRASDDAAGLSISEKMRILIRGLSQASKNAQHGISLCQVADGALNESHNILQRMNELAVTAANGTNNTEDRNAIQAEISQLVTELDRIASTTSFNEALHPLDGGKKLPDYIGTTSITMVNKTGDVLIYDGKEYQSGESIVVNDVLSIMSGPDYTEFEWAAIAYKKYQGSGGSYYYQHTSTYNTTWNITATNGPYEVLYRRLSDIKEDENGYLYFDDLRTSNRRYFTDGRFKDFDASQPDIFAKWDDSQSDIKLQVGSQEGQSITLSFVNASSAALGVSDVSVLSEAEAGATITKVRDAIDIVSQYRSQFGATQNRLEHTIRNLDNTVENTSDAESRIRDTDMAKEMVSYAMNNILLQVSQSMLAQSKQSAQGVLSLLQN